MLHNIENILRVPGRLCYNPTSLTTAYPHGGTGLGVVKTVRVKPYKVYHKITAEEFGSEAIDYVDGGESWILGAILRSFDKDALKLIFPSAVTGTITQEAVVAHPAADTAIRAGLLMSAKAVKLLFSPDDPARNPFLILYNAIPLIDESAEINLELDSDFTIGMLFAGIRSSAGKVMAMGLKEDLALT